MNKKRGTFTAILSAILITGLFHKQPLGLNLFIFESLFLTLLLYTGQFQFRGKNQITLGIGLILTSIFTIIAHSVFVYVTNFLVLFTFIGVLIYPNSKSLFSALGLSISNMISSQVQFLENLSGSNPNGKSFGSSIWRLRIFLIPVLIIILFIVLYRNSNPVFDNLVGNSLLFIQQKLGFILSDFDFLILLTFLISLIISIFLFIRVSNHQIVEMDKISSDELKRRKKRNRKKFHFKALLNEYKAGIFLFVVLNGILLVLNIIDIKWVWLGFDWEGQYLKQFVHEGTYLLILSIIISIVLVLYYFRGNLSFYTKNNFLKYLSYIWIAQNGILAISVAIRNFWYINYFALAYKRIGVIIFLILTLYGLYTVYIKVLRKRSAFYLFRSNTYAWFIVLILSSCINWDTIIAKYNFAHSDRSFLHLDYLSTLSDKALPYLAKPLPKLRHIDNLQKEKFPFEQKYMTPEKYHNIITSRKEEFRDKWESKSILSWNLTEYLAYKKLNNQ